MKIHLSTLILSILTAFLAGIALVLRYHLRCMRQIRQTLNTTNEPYVKAAYEAGHRDGFREGKAELLRSSAAEASEIERN
jgi:hypothetical protein